VANPVDLTGQVLATQGGIGACLEATLADRSVDAVILFLGMMDRLGEQIANEILAATALRSKPLGISWIAGPEWPIARLRGEGLCVTTSPGVAAARVLAHALACGARMEGRSLRPKPKSSEVPTVAPAGTLTGQEARSFLREIGIPVPRHTIVGSCDDAEQVAG